jgi:hypothetical protein
MLTLDTLTLAGLALSVIAAIGLAASNMGIM